MELEGGPPIQDFTGCLYLSSMGLEKEMSPLALTMFHPPQLDKKHAQHQKHHEKRYLCGCRVENHLINELLPHLKESECPNHSFCRTCGADSPPPSGSNKADRTVEL